eukprot:tig00020904_g15278.t1
MQMTSAVWNAAVAPEAAADGAAAPPLLADDVQVDVLRGESKVPSAAPKFAFSSTAAASAVQFHGPAPSTGAGPSKPGKKRVRDYSAAPLPDPRPEASIRYYDAALSFARGVCVAAASSLATALERHGACLTELEHAAWLGKRLLSFSPGGQTLHALGASISAASTADPARVASAVSVLSRVDEIHAQDQKGAGYAKAVQDLATKIRPQGTSVVEPDAQTPIKALDVMVSYRRVQTAEMEVVTRILKDRGLTYWVDVSTENGILKGVQWGKAIAAAIKGASTMVVLLTPDWIQSQYCIDEFEYACAQHKRVVVVELAPVPPLADDLDDDATESQRGFLRRQKMCMEAINSWQKIPFPALFKQSPEALPKLSADPAFVKSCDDMEAAIRQKHKIARFSFHYLSKQAARLHTQLTLRADKYKEALGFDAGTKWVDTRDVHLKGVPKENRTKAEAVLLHGFALEEAFDWLKKAEPETAKRTNYTVADMFHIPTSMSRLWPWRSKRDIADSARQSTGKGDTPFLKPTPEQVVLIRHSLKHEVRKKRTIAIIAAVIASALLAAAIVSIVFAISAAQQKAEAETQSRRASEEAKRATEAAQRALEQEALATLNAARALNASILAEQRANEALANLQRATAAEAEARNQSAIARANELLALAAQNETALALLAAQKAQNETAKALLATQAAQSETAKALVAAQVAQNETAKALVATQAALAEAQDRQAISAALSNSGSDPEAALLFAMEALASAVTRTNAALTTAAESTLRSVLESGASGYLWTGGSTPARRRERRARSLLEVDSYSTIADFATGSSFYDFQTFTATSPRGTLTIYAGVGVVAPTATSTDVNSPTQTFQMHLLGQVYDDSNKLVYTIRDALVGSANKSSYWAFSLGSIRFFVDDYGDVVMHVKRLGPETPVCTDLPKDTEGIGCLPRTTSTVFIYSGRRPDERGCLKKDGMIASDASFLLETHDVFVASNVVAFFTGETKGATPWRGVEDIFKNTNTAKGEARPRNVMRIHRGQLSFADAPAPLYQGYLPNTPELCHFIITAESWITIELPESPLRGLENPAALAEEKTWRTKMAYGYPFANPVAVAQRTCSRGSEKYLAAAVATGKSFSSDTTAAGGTVESYNADTSRTLKVILIPMATLTDASKTAADVFSSMQLKESTGLAPVGGDFASDSLETPAVPDFIHNLGKFSFMVGITDLDVSDNCSWIAGILQVHGPGSVETTYSLFGYGSTAVAYHLVRAQLTWAGGSLTKSSVWMYVSPIHNSVRTIKYTPLAPGTGYRSTLVAADDAGNFARLELKSTTSTTPIRKKGPNVLDAEVADNTLDPESSTRSWIAKLGASFANVDNLGPNRALFLKSPTMCHLFVTGQKRAMYWDVDVAGGALASMTQLTQLIKPFELKALQHSLGIDGSRKSTTLDGQMCDDCNDDTKNYRFFGVHQPTGNLMALSATGGTLYTGDGRCAENQASRIAPSKTWSWMAKPEALPWTATRNTVDANAPKVIFSDAFAPFMGAAAEPPTAGFNSVIQSITNNPEEAYSVAVSSGPVHGDSNDLSLPSQYFPSAQENAEPLAFHESSWAAMAGVLYPLDQGVPVASSAVSVFEMNPALRSAFVPKHKDHPDVWADFLNPDDTFKAPPTLSAYTARYPYVHLTDVQHAAGFSGDGLNCAFCFSYFYYAAQGAGQVAWDQYVYQNSDEQCPLSPTLTCLFQQERSYSAAERVVVMLASRPSATSSVWTSAGAAFLPTWSGPKQRACRRVLFWGSIAVLDMRAASSPQVPAWRTGYLPNTPELCHFIITAESWITIELPESPLRGLENPAALAEEKTWRTKMAYGYPFANPVAVAQRTCSRGSEKYLAAAVATGKSFSSDTTAAGGTVESYNADTSRTLKFSFMVGITDLDVSDNCSWIAGILQVHGPGSVETTYSLFGYGSTAVAYHLVRAQLTWAGGSLTKSSVWMYVSPIHNSLRNFASLTCWDVTQFNLWRLKNNLIGTGGPCVFTRRTNPDFLNEDANNVKAADPDLILVGIVKDDPDANTLGAGQPAGGYGALLLRKAGHKTSGLCVRQQLVFMPFSTSLPSLYRKIAELDCGAEYTGSPNDLRRKAMSVSVIDGGPFITVGGSAGGIEFYDLRTPQDLLTTKTAEVVSLSGRVRTIKYTPLAPGTGYRSTLVAADDAGNFARLELKSTTSTTPIRKKGPNVLDAEVADNTLDPESSTRSWIAKLGASFANVDNLGPNRALFLKSPTMCHLFVTGQKRAMYWDVDVAGGALASMTQLTQLIKPFELKALQHSLGIDGSRKSTTLDGQMCDDCNDDTKNYRFFGVHQPTGNLMALSATGGTLYTGDGRCAENQASRIAPSKTWSWMAKPEALPWTATRNTVDANAPKVIFSDAFAPFMGAAAEPPTAGFNSVIHNDLSLPSQYFPSAQENAEPLAFHESSWAAMAGVLYPLDQGVPVASSAVSVFEMNPALRSAFVPKHKDHPDVWADFLNPDDTFKAPPTLSAYTARYPYVHLTDVQHAAGFSGDGLNCAFCFSYFYYAAQGAGQVAWDQYVYQNSDEQCPLSPTLTCLFQQERSYSAAERVVVMLASRPSATSSVWTSAGAAFLPTWSGPKQRACRRVLFWGSIAVLDMRAAVLAVPVVNGALDTGRSVQVEQRTRAAPPDATLPDPPCDAEGLHSDPGTGTGTKRRRRTAAETAATRACTKYREAKNRITKNQRSGPGFPDASVYVSTASVLWLVDATGARAYKTFEALSGRPQSPDILIEFSKYPPRASRNGRFVAVWKTATFLQIYDLELGAEAADYARPVPVDASFVNPLSALPAYVSVSDDGAYLAIRHLTADSKFGLRVMDVSREALLRASCGVVSRGFDADELTGVYGSSFNRTTRVATTACSSSGTSGTPATQRVRRPAGAVARRAPPSKPVVVAGSWKGSELRVFVHNRRSGDAIATEANVTCVPDAAAAAAGAKVLSGAAPMNFSIQPRVNSRIAAPGQSLDDWDANLYYMSRSVPPHIVAEFLFTDAAPDTAYTCTATVRSGAGFGDAAAVTARTQAAAYAGPPAPRPSSISKNSYCQSAVQSNAAAAAKCPVVV